MYYSNHIQFLKQLVLTNLKASVSLRGAFLLQALFMMLNNLIFFSVWWIFFQNFDEIRGWKLPELALLYGITATCCGFTMVFGGGMRNLASMISSGDLDAFMTQPKNLLAHTVGSDSIAFGWGDIISGSALIYLSGYTTWLLVPKLVLIIFCSTTILLSTGIMINCLAFWFGHIEALGKQLFEFVITFCVYPQNIFSGFLKLVLFTVIPAGFIGYLPVELLRNFSWFNLLGVVGSALFYGTLAVFIFYKGLKRYESGNQFGVRT